MATVTGMTAARMLEIEAGSVVNAHIDGSSHLIFTKHDGTTIDAGPILTAFPIASDILQGIVELATDVETIDGGDGTRAVTPLGLAALTSTDVRRGLVELSTPEEVATGTDDTRAITPAGLAALVATATAKGIVELATNAETATGTDDTRAVTPAALAALLATSLATKQNLDSDLTTIAGLAPADDSVLQRKSGVWSGRTMAQLATDLSATGEFSEISLYNGTSYADADGAKVYVGTADPGSVTNGSVWFDTTP